MKDDYLWDPSGPPDPDVVRLEQMLGRLRSTATVPPITVRLKPPFDVAQGGPEVLEGQDTTGIVEVRGGARAKTYVGVRFLGPALAAAAAIALMVGLTWPIGAPAASWEVAALIGTPRIGSSALLGEGRIAVGQVDNSL